MPLAGARGGANGGGGGPDIPFFTGSLFGTALRMFADAMTRGAYPGGAAGSPFESPARAGLKQGPDGLPVFPRRFIAQEAVSLTVDSLLQPQRGQRQARLTWDLQEAATGEYLGRLDQHGVDDLGACIKFHNPQGATVAKATRVWTHDAKAAKASDSAAVIKAALERGARGQVVSLVGARTNATLAKVVEFAPGDYASPLTRWLNAFYTSFVVLDDRGEESAMVRRYAVPRLFSYYRGVDAHGQRVVECRLPLALVRWKTRWAFERSAAAMAEGESEDEAWRREMRGEAKKKGRLHSLVFPVMAAFHSIDTHQTSLFKRILG